MLRLCLGVVFVGSVAVTQAAEFEEGFFVPGLNLLTTQFAPPDTDFLSPYQFSASVVLTHPSDTASIGLGLGSTFQLPSIAKPQQETTPAINARWHQTYDDDPVSLQRFLSVELKGEQTNIILRPHSVSIEGERLKITFRPQSALIEGERFNILLQPHAVSMLWSKAF